MNNLPLNPSEHQAQPSGWRKGQMTSEVYKKINKYEALQLPELPDGLAGAAGSEIVERVRQLVDALDDANHACRSAYAVAMREGKKTNWLPFQRALKDSLDRQHKVMFPNND